MRDYIDVVLDAAPEEGGRFLDVEFPDGKSVNLHDIGEWIDRGDGTWSLRIRRIPASS